MSNYGFPALFILAAANLGASDLPARPREAPANASSLQPKASIQVESLRKIRAFQADGTWNLETTARLKVLRESGLKELAVLVFPYSSGCEALAIDYVRVRKPDGSVVVTPPENIQDLSAEVARQAPMYSDNREKQVAVKALEVGDTLEFHVQDHAFKADVPGQFWFGFSFRTTEIVRESLAEVSYPADKAVQIISPGLDPEMTTEGGRKILRWHQANPEAQLPPVRAPWKGQPADAIQVTTFGSWQELGAWYRGLQEPQAQVTPAIQRKADELTRGLALDLDRIKALYDFVAFRIHYIGLSFGIGRYRPHPAEEVLANGYGDCKDKHTLLESLLKASGLEAWPALIRAGGDIRPEVPSPGQFDHVITVVPLKGGRLWLDATPEVGPFGFLTMNLRGKPALVIPRSAPAYLENTPETAPFPMRTAYAFKGKLEVGGRITGHCEVSYRGDTELGLRQAFRQVAPNRWQDVVTATSSPVGLGYAFTSIQPGPAENTRIPFLLNWDLSREAPEDWKAGRLILPLPALGMEQLARSGSKATDPIFLGPDRTIQYRAVLALPASSTPTVPSAVNLSSAAGEYHAIYAFDKGLFTAERRLTIHGGEVAPENREAFNAFCQAISTEEDQFVQLSGEGTQAGPQDPEAVQLFQKGLEAMQHEDFIAAREAYRKTLERAPSYPGAHGNYGITYLAKGDLQTGIRELLKEAELHPELPMTFAILGNVYLSQGRKGEAIAQWTRAMDKDPDNHEVLASLLHALHGEKRYQDAVTQLKKYLARDPDNAACLLWLAEDLAQIGPASEVEAPARKAIGIDGSPECLLRAAQALLDAGEATGLARTWVEQAGTGIQAESLTIKDDLAKGMANTAALTKAWEVQGRLHLKDGRPAEAVRFLKAAWSLTHAGTSGAWLAQAYERLGQTREAEQQYKLAAVAEGADRQEIARRFRKLTGRELEDGYGHVFRNGKPLPAPSEQLLEQRTGHFPCPPRPQGTVNVIVELSPAGAVEVVHFLERAEDFRSQEGAFKKLTLRAVFPDATPRRVFLRGGVEFGAHGGTFISVWP